MQCGYSLHAESNSASNELPRSKFEEKQREICQKYEQKNSFFMTNMSIQLFWLTHFIKILLVLEYQLIKKLWLACFLIIPILDPKFPLMHLIAIQTQTTHNYKTSL